MVDQPNPGDIQPSFSISFTGDGFKNATRFDNTICIPKQYHRTLVRPFTYHDDNFKVYFFFTSFRVEICVCHSTFNSDNFKKSPHQEAQPPPMIATALSQPVWESKPPAARSQQQAPQTGMATAKHTGQQPD